MTQNGLIHRKTKQPTNQPTNQQKREFFQVNEFEFQSLYCIHFWTNTLRKSIEAHYLSAYGLLVPLPFFSKNDFGIK